MHRSALPTCACALVLLACGGSDAPSSGPSNPGACNTVNSDAGPVVSRTCTPPGTPVFVDGHTVGASSAPPGCTKPVAAVASNYGVQKFCGNAVGTSIRFNVPAGTGSVSIVSQAYSAQDSVNINDGGVPNSVAPTSVVDPNGRTLLDTPYSSSAPDGADAGIFYGGLSPSTGVLTFPDTSYLLSEVAKNQTLPAGTWSFTVDDLANDCRLFSNCSGGGAGGSYDITIVTKPLAPSSGTIDVAFYLVENSGYTSSTAVADAATPTKPMGRMIQTLGTLLGKAGLCMGTVTFYDVPAWAQNAYSTTIDADKTGPCSTLNQMFANLAQPGNVLNLFLVGQITSSSQAGTTVVGIDGTIPGPAGASPNVHGGAAVSFADISANFATNCLPTGGPNYASCGADEVAYVAAHESGHFMGLYHTTEQLGDAFDPLNDTPKCPCSTCASSPSKCGSDPATSYQMSVADCTVSPSCGGGDDLMFWLFGSGSTGSVSAEQGQVVRGSPVVQ